MADNVVDILLRARMEAGDVASGVDSIQKALNGLTLPKNISGDLEKSFGRLGPLLKDYQKQLDKGFKTPKDLKNLELLKGKISDVFGEIKSKVQEANGQEIRFKADTQEISKLEKELDGLQAKLSDKINNIYKSGQTNKGISKGIGDLQRALSAQFKSGNFKFPALKELTSGLRQALDTKDFANFNSQIDNIRDRINSLSANNKLNIADSLGLKYVANDANSAGNAINTFLNKLQVNKTAANSIETLRSKITETGTVLQQLKFDSATRGAEALGNASAGIDQMANSLLSVNQNASSAANGMLSMQQQVDQLKTSTQYFFSLRNMINLLRRGISQAVDTIKELDAAMTQTAVVVPEWDVGDMWAKLPEYTQNANKLGSTVVDLYKATTLYYQQGLRGNEVMDIAAETMKMARIGGLEAADATDKMTAALRGFNMEINQESAQRINDVYSNLAANTASNTEELGTAMQRTASIAASAGMSFEGTAAFLAQAIETTREPAENLGTAMKTIVARFTELKKNPLEITEVDGEEVSYNKVDTALQSIGVSLKDANGQFRDLDQVFLDISQRWDNLTQTQQRYIATQAAGSRQQSRFIAMMSNYQRTTELMDFANNSEGASQEQFEKTMESLQAKMNKLKNAWDRFLMGITDNQIVKGAVDGLTKLIDGVNNLINTLSFGIGPVKSFMSLMTAFVGLKMGGRLINSAIGGLGGMIDPTSSFSAGFRGGMIGRGNPALASQIYNPIVAAIHELGAAMGHTFGNGNSANSLFNKTADQIRYDAYKSAHQEFKNIAFNRGDYGNRNATVNDLTKSLSKLDIKDQNFLGKAFFNTTNAAKQAVFGAWAKRGWERDHSGEGRGAFQNYNRDAMQMLNKADKAIYANVKNNSLPLSEYFKQIQDPTVVRQALENVRGGTESPIYGYFKGLEEDITKRTTDRTAEIEKQINSNSKLSAERKKELIKNVESEATQRKIRERAAKAMNGAPLTGEETFKNSTTGQLLDHISGFGSSMASAGMGLRSFGSLLQQSANPAIATFGTALTTMGSLLSGVGMGITGLTSAFSSASASIATATGLAAGAATALTAGLFGLVAVIGLAIAMEQKRRADIKKRAEEITTNYKDKSKETTSNINDLQSWESEMPRLAKGVDKNGNNINLDASDYQHYLEIVDRIAELNPEIVKGYNAQGHAIVDNNTALQKTLDLQKDNQKQAIEEYTSDDSIKALIEARDLNKTLGGYVGGRRTAGGKYTQFEYKESMLAPQKTMREQAQKMAQTLTEAGLSSKDFKDFGLDLSALEQGDQAAINILSNNIDKIKTRAKSKMQELGDEVSDDTKKAFDKSMSGFADAAGELDEMITPLYDALSARMSSSNVFQDIPDDMVTYFNQGLKNIAADSTLSFDQMMHESRDLSNEFVNLTAKGTDYDKAMDKIAEAQEKFGENLDTAAYDKVADDVVKDLNKIKDGVDSTSAYGQALTEFLDNQIAQIENFTEEGAVNVADALNTMSDEITAAEGALESFKKVEEGSNFTTAAQGMKEIYDTITDSEKEHKGGHGDQTWWAGAETLFGRNNLIGKNKKEIEGMLKAYEPLLQEGQKGWDAFKQRWFDAYDAGKFKELEKNGLELYDNGWLKKWDDSINPDIFKQMADALNMSEDSLTAMLNKGRQFGSISFANLKEVREGLATSDSVIAGERPKKGGKRNLYIKEDALNAEFANAGITDINQQEKYKTRLEKEQNIKVITGAAQIALKEFQNMGIQSQKSLITILGETGQYTKEEIQDYAERYAKVNKEAFDKAQFNKDFKYYQAESDPIEGEQLHTLESLDGTVMSILKQMQSDVITSGNLTDFKGKDLVKSVIGKKGVADTATQLFGQGFKLDKNGEQHVLTPKEYEKTSKQLGDIVTENEEYIKQLKTGKRAAEKAGDTEQAKAYEQEIKDVKRVNKEIERNLAIAQKNMASNKLGALNTLGFKSTDKKSPLSNIKNFDVESEEAQKALQSVYEAAMNPGKKLTSKLMENMELLGIDIEQAIEDGLVVDPQGIYQKALEEEKKKKEAEDKARDEANKGEKPKTKSEEKPKTNEEEKPEAPNKKKLEQENRKETNNGTRYDTEKPTPSRKGDITTVPGVGRVDSLGQIEGQSFWNLFKEYWTSHPIEPNTTPITTEEQQAQNEFNSRNTFLNTLSQKISELFKPQEPTKTQSETNTSGLDEAGTKIDEVGDKAADTANKINETAITSDEAAARAELYSRNSTKLSEIFSSFIESVTSGLGGLTKGAKEFNKAATPTSSPSLQGKPKQKGTTIPGVGFVPSGGKAEKKEPEEQAPQSQAITLTINADYTQVTEAKKEINSTIKAAEKGAVLKVTSTNDVESTQKKLGQVQKQVSKGVRGGKVSLSTSADTSGAYKGIDNIIAKAKKTTAKVKVTSVKASGAYKAIDELKDYASKSVSFSVDVKSGNKRSFNVTVEGKYLGQNNTGRVPQLPNVGSAATGTSRPGTGRLGPKGKGGLTLTGELGYEVAWLPRENRSMILGVNGPEMVNLPDDAVVWNHEQSKQIIKKNQIPSGSAAIGAGSAYGESGQEERPGAITPIYRKVTKGGSTTKGQNNSNSKKNNKYQEKILKQTWKLLGTAGKISNWWEDISRQVEGIQRIADRNQKDFKKLIDTAGTTLANVQKNSETYSKSLQKSIQLNEEIVKHYKDKLDALTSGKGQSAKSRKGAVSGINKAANEVTKAEAKVELAKQTKSKKDDKKAKKNLRNAKKRLKNAKKKDKSAAVDTVTYDDEIQVTTKKKTRKGKGKWKNKTVKKKKKVKSTRAVDWSKIIEYDAETDTWVLNDKEINKQAGGNKKAAKAIKEKGNKKIDEMIQRRNGAQDKIDSARESLNQLAEDVYQMFSRWEKSLTHVYLISQKLESLQKKADIYDTQEEYLSTKALAGYNPFSQESLDKLNTILTNRQNSLVEQAKAQKDLVDATYKQYEEAFQFNTYLTNGNTGSETGGESQSGVNEQEAASIAFQLLKKAGAENIDTYDSVKVQQAYDEYTKGRYTNKTDEEVKKILDRIAEYQGSYYDALKESYTSVTEIYKTLNEYEEYINDFEESLLKGLEEEINKEIDKQEKLNSALTDAFKDLLDEVKRRLDQRRQAEDNAKTESDIAKKQQRLATLQADTSGGHASEIKQLQQEIAEAQQNYGRTLEDQLLERLQQQGDEAAKQRERQIKLLEIQRDLAEALGTNLEEVKKWLQNPEANKEQIKSAWLANQNYDEALPDQQKTLENQFEEAWTKYLAYGARAQDLREFLDEVNFDNTPEKQAAQSLQTIETDLGGLKETIEGEVKKKQAAAGEKSHNYINEVEEPTIDYGKISNFKENGVELEEARTKAENLGIDNSYASMREGGYTAEDFKKAKVSASDALGAGFNHTQLKEGGYTAEDFKNSNLGAVEAAKAGFGYGDLIKGGYTYQDILNQQSEFEALAQANGGLKSDFIAQALAEQESEEIRKKEREQQKQIALRDVKYIAKQIDPNNPTGKKAKEMLFAWATNNNSFLKEFAGMAIPMKTGSGHINSNGQLYFNDKKGNVKRFNFTNGKFSNVKYNQKDWEKHAGYNQVSDTPYIMAEFQQALKKRNAKKYIKFTNKAPILEMVPIANAIAAYASGGMNYTTGPAWLDGTRAKPEAVLNATDTKNFIALKDILSDVMGHITDNNTTTYGDSTYEININVDHLNNDYDVDKVAKRVEKIITEDASYRNVTMVRKFR